MKKKPSILRQTVLLLQIQILTVVLVLALAAGITLYSARERIETTGKNLLEVYSSRMEDRLSKAWQSLSGVLYENYDLDLLASANEQERYYASTRIITSLENVMKTNDSAQMLVIADAVFDICLEANDGHLSLEEKSALRDYAFLCARDRKSGKGWQFVRIGGRQYLHRLVQTNTRAALVFISASSLMVEIRKANMDSMEFLLTDTAGQIMASAGSGMSGLTVPDHMAEIEQDRFFLCSAALADKKAGLFCLQKKTALLRQMKDGGLLLVGAALLLLLFDYYIFRLLRRKLVLPMERTTGVMEEISAGNPDLRLPREEETMEFVTLADTFNHLMDELVSLRIEYYEKKIALQETEEKYIRLQIRPHFFLNAMTTIASLSAKG
ncbi:MAG: hypothetical protein IIY55_01500, partial [Blautia sp.]|nr:hypothetical protein [Blautia sp.]